MDMTTKIEPPEPIVRVPGRSGAHVKTRTGRGFSLSEIKAVGLDVERARKLGLRVDENRGSCYEENVKRLKEFLEKIPRLEKTVDKSKPSN